MHGKHGALMMAAMLAGACGVARSSEEDQKQALERRVAELEQKLAAAERASASAAGESAAKAPEATSTPADEVAAVAEPAAPIRHAQAAPTRSTDRKATSSRASAPAHAVEPREPKPARAPILEAREHDLPPVEPIDPAPIVAAAPPQLSIPKDTTLHLVLEDALSSEYNHAGDRVVARVEQAVSDTGEIVLPGGSYVEGRVLSAQPSGRVKGKARVDVAIEHIVVRGSRYRLQTTGLTLEADDSHRRDAAVVAGGTVVGAILGKIAGGSATKGAVLGGAAGGGAVLATKGKEIDLPAGSRVLVRVTRSRDIQG